MGNVSQSASSIWAPFRITPWFSKRVWGCRDLRPWYDVVVDGQDEEPVGEAWLTGDKCIVASGVHAGQTLATLFAESGEAMLGPVTQRQGVSGNGSPLLIKVIFALEKLSVQVHPDDRMAQKYGQPRGKTECWYALEASSHAQVALGLKPGVTLNDLLAGIETETLEDCLNVINVSTQDMIFVDAGTVHAIWPGATLLEIQQNCDLTYRMYDYGRGRELHVEKALEATSLRTQAGKTLPHTLGGRTHLMDGKYFRVERVTVTDHSTSASLRTEDETAHKLSYLFVAAGAGRISSPKKEFESVDLPRGAIVAVPAASPEFTVEAVEELELIRVTPVWPEAKEP